MSLYGEFNIPEPNPPMGGMGNSFVTDLLSKAIASQNEKVLPAAPKAPPMREAVGSFMSDLLFSMAQSFAAGPQRGAGIAAALMGPTARRSLIQQAQDEHEKTQMGLMKSQAEIAKLNADLVNSQRTVEFRTVERNEKKIQEAFNKTNGQVLYSQEIGTVEPKNIDPLSEEGIAASVKKEKQIAELKPSADTPEEKFISLALQEGTTKNNGQKLTTEQEKEVRKQAREEWGDASKDPQMQELLLQGRQLQNQLAQDALDKRRNNELNVNDNRRVDAVISKFNSADIVKDFVERQNKYEGMKALLARGWSGPGDLALVFAFMKALDPTSVVRESEYEAAAKSGNIFKGWAAKFNGMLKPSGGFLGDQVKGEFLGIARSQLDVTAKQYQQFRKGTAAQINRIAKQDVGEEWLPNYGGAFESAPSTVTMKAPDGQTKQVPAEQVEHYKSLGATVVVK